MKKLLAIAALAALLAPAASPAYAGRCWVLKPLCPGLQVPVCVCNPLGQCTWLCGGN